MRQHVLNAKVSFLPKEGIFEIKTGHIKEIIVEGKETQSVWMYLDGEWPIYIILEERSGSLHVCKLHQLL